MCLHWLTIIFVFVIILATSQFLINNRPNWSNCSRLDDRVLSAIHCRSENNARAEVTSCPETRPGRRHLQAALSLSLSLFHCLVRVFLVTCHVMSTPASVSRHARQYQCQSVCPEDGMWTCHRTSVAWLLWAWNKRKEVLAQVARALNLLHTALANLFDHYFWHLSVLCAARYKFWCWCEWINVIKSVSDRVFLLLSDKVYAIFSMT